MGIVLFKLSELTGFYALKHRAIIKLLLLLTDYAITGGDYHCILVLDKNLLTDNTIEIEWRVRFVRGEGENGDEK
jgi:hypothetical protein